MQQHKTVEDYLCGVIPEKIPDSKKAELRAELESHIYDKAEFYIEIGYDEQVAFQKAVEEMGETQSVNAEFCSLYNDSSLKGMLLFLGMCTMNLLSVSTFGTGYWYFVEPSMHHFPNMIELTAFLAGFIFLTVHTIKCCRQKLHKQLSGMTAAYAIMALASAITSGLFYPVLNAGYLVCCYITNSPEPERDLAVPVNVLVLVAYTVLSFMSLNKDYRYRTKPYRLSLKQITVILSVVGLCFMVVYGFAYEKYEYYYSNDEAYEEMAQEDYLSNIISEQKNIYDSIKGEDDVSYIEKMLSENGFVKQDKAYKNFIDDNYMLPYRVRDYLLEKNAEQVKNSEHVIYCYNNIMDAEDESDDIISCIVITYNGNNEITYKLFIPDTEGKTLNGSYQSYNHGEQTAEWFNNLHKGESIESALEFIRTTNSYIIEDEKYEGDKTVNTYKINMQCHYTFDVTVIDFLFGADPDSVDYSFDIKIEAKNGVVTNVTDCDEDYN